MMMTIRVALNRARFMRTIFHQGVVKKEQKLTFMNTIKKREGRADLRGDAEPNQKEIPDESI